jgi:hypothetical protein
MLHISERCQNPRSGTAEQVPRAGHRQQLQQPWDGDMKRRDVCCKRSRDAGQQRTVASSHPPGPSAVGPCSSFLPVLCAQCLSVALSSIPFGHRGRRQSNSNGTAGRRTVAHPVMASVAPPFSRSRLLPPFPFPSPPLCVLRWPCLAGPPQLLAVAVRPVARPGAWWLLCAS